MAKRTKNNGHQRKKKIKKNVVITPKCARRILPRMYKNNGINQQQAAELCNNKKNIGYRHQVNGLVYNPNQMPNVSSDNNWPVVSRAPTKKNPQRTAEFDLGPGNGSIMIHHPEVKIERASSIHVAAEFALKHHSRNRVIEGEGGVMVSAGRRFEYRSSTVVPYVNKHFAGVDRQDDHGHNVFNKGISSFHELIRSTPLKDTFLGDIECLKQTGNVLNLRSREGTSYAAHMSYAVSHNLSNSPHIDTNDASKSFDLFYTLPSEPGRAWLLFPDHGIAIELCGTVFVCWDGRIQHHCSRTVSGNVYSLFAGSRKDVGHYYRVQNAFLTPKSNTCPIQVGEKVYVRDKLKNMKGRKYDDPYAHMYPQYMMHRQAIVTFIDPANHMVSVDFIGKLKKYGTQKFATGNVCRV